MKALASSRKKQKRKKKMGDIIKNIRKITAGMSKKEKVSYILTYYWYHILGILAFFGLIIFLIVHFAFPEEKPLFTCALVNQRIDSSRDQELAEDFAAEADLPLKQVVFDSDYVISYRESEETSSTGSNESGFDKFFFKWSGGELDAVVMTEDFMSYCMEVGGSYYSADQFDTEGLDLCTLEGVSAIRVSGTKLEACLDGVKEDNLVLAFPDTGKHRENCQKFIEYLKGEQG